MRRAALLILGLGLALAGAAESQPARGQALRLALPTSLGAPLVDWEEQQVRGGLIPQLVRHIAEARGLRTEFIALPPARLRAAALSSEFDVLCLPDAQRGAEQDALEWAAPLLDISALLVGHAEAPRLEQLADAPPDTVVGSVQGLSVPTLDSRAADGRLRREDAFSEDRLAKKLGARRHPYAVLSQPAASYWRAQGMDLGPWALPMDRLRLQCGLARRSPLSAAQWGEAQDAVRQAGLLARLTQQAHMPGFAVVVSRANALRELPEQQFLDLYLARRTGLAGGRSPRLLMLGGLLRTEATRQLLRREPGDYAAQWTAQQFGGRRRAPEEFDDPLALRAMLQRDANALGVLPLWAVDASLRVLAFR